MNAGNFDKATVESFGQEWSQFDQSAVDAKEISRLFQSYFGVFPWHALPANAAGFDMGCGSGRWAALVAPQVGKLTCIDPSPEALDVARENLKKFPNVEFINTTANGEPLAPESQDFGYSLGVLHHVPDTAGAMAACVRMLKPGAPFLVYLYYRFDNRPAWFRAIWKMTEWFRGGISKMPHGLKHLATDIIAVAVYWPLARLAKVLSLMGIKVSNLPLSAYRDLSFYTMRTDSRDRFGTPLEQRFTRREIEAMMHRAGLKDVRFSENEPYWCAVGLKA